MFIFSVCVYQKTVLLIPNQAALSGEEKMNTSDIYESYFLSMSTSAHRYSEGASPRVGHASAILKFTGRIDTQSSGFVSADHL
jgi:hypothetical protein